MIDEKPIYLQLRNFNNAPSNPNVANSKSVVDTYLYVNDAVAVDSSNFLSFLLDTRIKDVKERTGLIFLDMAFGSGNLTSHLVLDNFKDITKIIFNDKNKEANDKLEKDYPTGTVQFLKNDFLNKTDWVETSEADVIIFNPQIGGSYKNGDAGFEKITPILSNFTIEEYLFEKGIDVEKLKISEDESIRKILIQSDDYTKSQLSAYLKDIKIFNYYDVFYQAKSGKEEGIESKIVKFRATFDSLLSEDGWLIFMGSQEYFKYLFADFNTVFDYWANGNKTGQHLFVASKTVTPLSICYEKVGNDFVSIPNCEKKTEIAEKEGDLDELEDNINDLFKKLLTTTQDDSVVEIPKAEETSQQSERAKEPFTIKRDEKGSLSFPYKNILLKGVPGTGKSYLINKLIKNKLALENATNVLRVNIHSASSNADMMQGIGVSTNTEGLISYHEKKGLILHHIQKAIEYPFQPFVIVLEEIQENSLNQLIGDLIYLIEDEKRANIGDAIDKIGDTFEDMEDFLEKLNADYFVEVPYLVSTETRYRKLVIPDNLYFFCTSNYRDDKKIVEDNLLRRFDLIEIYPTYEDVIKHSDVAQFLKALNDSILKHFKSREIHPDRFMIGHASWINVKNEKTFCRALLKAITEFKDIREIEFSDIEPVLNDLKTLPFALKHSDILRGDYKTIIDTLQKLAYDDILDA